MFVPLIIVFFSTADNVTITGSGGPLPQIPLMDTFDEYTQDSWTYDGRYSLTFSPFILYFTINVVIQHFTIRHIGSILPAFTLLEKRFVCDIVSLDSVTFDITLPIALYL